MADMDIIRKQSAENLQCLLKKLSKYRIRNSVADVDTVLEALPIYHCIPDTNILEVLKSQEIHVKNQVVKGEHTNLSTDFFQGFDNHLSMSIAEPWIEYGQYFFAFGFEHIHEDSLCFSDDPWLWSTTDFQKRVLVKADFLIYARALLLRNMYRVSKIRYIPVAWKLDLHKLAVHNFKKWEVKQAANLRMLDADEFFIWTGTDRFIFLFLKIATAWPTILLGLLLIGLMIFGMVTS